MENDWDEFEYDDTVQSVADELLDIYAERTSLSPDELTLSFILAAAMMSRSLATTMEEYSDDIEQLAQIFKDACVSLEAQRRKDQGIRDNLTDLFDKNRCTHKKASDLGLL